MNDAPNLPCLCASLRRAARALTQRYEEALRPLDLRASQFTILQVLSVAGEMTQGQLGRMLFMDSTTLTRTLDVMSRHRWISRHRGDDRREWRINLSVTGKMQLSRALPHWDRAQARVRQELGGRHWDELMKLTNHVTHAVTQKGALS